MDTTHASAQEVRAALAEIQGHEAWAVIRRKAGDRDGVGLVGGAPHGGRLAARHPARGGRRPTDGRIADRLVAVPFRQVRERGFDAIDDGTPLVVVDIDASTRSSSTDLLEALADDGDRVRRPRRVRDLATRTTPSVVEAIIRDEIGQGEGANLVIGRHYRAAVADWDAAEALTVLRRLLERERGAYWTFCFFTGDRFLDRRQPGAARQRARRRRADEPDLRHLPGRRRPRPTTLKPRLLDFLADEKEVFELFMVVDEELKMMCEICHEGGQVLGPFLKPMTHLIHTEYLLAGRTDRDVREILRDTMYAATVTGAPVENACRLIAEYESEGRGYYGAALALFGRDADGHHALDSPILIRTADVASTGGSR